MAHNKGSRFHSWEWDGYRLRRCTRCGLCEEHVELGLLHSPPSEWRETVEANNHFAAVDRARSLA